MEVNARFYNRIRIVATCVLTGALGSALLYYGIFFALALVNYFDNFYKHDTFYALYPTAASYLCTFFSTGTLKHLPGYEIEFNVGIPLLFGCGMVFLGFLLLILLRNNCLQISQRRVSGKGILGKAFEAPAEALLPVKRIPFAGLLLTVQDRRKVFLFVKNREQILAVLAGEKTIA